jgi:hypothetical protein
VWVVLLGLMGAIQVAGAWGDPAPTPNGALEAIDGCLHRINPDVDVGYDRIVGRCPVLVRRLQESGAAAWLPVDWQRPGNDLSAGGLRELRELLVRELRVSAPEGAHHPGTQHVGDILASLVRVDEEHSGWWARTRAWLRNLFASTDEAADEGWLGRMTGHSGVSQTVLELVSYIALALVVVLTLVIVANELRVSGVWGGDKRRRGGVRGAGSRTATAAGLGGAAPLDWEGVQSSPLAQRLGLLFELVIARLNERGGARLSRGLTVRELLSAAPLADERDRKRLGALARASERVRFSEVVVSEAEVAEVVEEGRLLLEGIGGVSSGGTASSSDTGPSRGAP